MDIIKLIGIAIVALVIIIVMRQYKPEFAIYVSLVAGVLIISLTFETLSKIINIVNEYSSKLTVSSSFITILIKITGIAILSEFAISICKDAGETSIATKVDVGSKILIIGTSMPIVTNLLEVVLRVLP